ncbi:MAG: ribosome assembly RNA-binding protein YhbY [Gammaproteobacteria bacterium]|nr:ribosome assembly RNA-binding protein YhbY [Gammaproteobacteria bacterium]
MELTGKQKRYLRSLAHHRQVVVSIGQAGLTEAVMAEIENALDHHELIKIKLSDDDKSSRNKTANDICQKTNAAQVQQIGKSLSIYRAAQEAKIILP